MFKGGKCIKEILSIKQEASMLAEELEEKRKNSTFSGMLKCIECGLVMKIVVGGTVSSDLNCPICGKELFDI